MSRGNRNGPTASIQRVLGWDNGDRPAMRAQVATCHCGAELRFTTGEYGQTLEVCTSRRCEGRIPHPVRPDPAAPAQDPWVPTKRRTKAQAHPQSET